MSNLLTPDVLGAVSSLTNYNANLDEIENSFGAQGYFVVTGLVPSIGTGLSVNVTAGTALVAGLVTVSAGFAIGGLTPSTTNHLYLNQNGTGTSNTSGTQPALTTKLGTATTSGVAVTSVNVLRSSGRQSLIRPENQVPGAVGSPGSLNLASWAASAADATQFFGTLPAGTLPANVFLKDADQTLSDGTDIAVGTGTGTKVGTATSQKLGFFNATPVVQPANTVDILTGLSDLGLRASGGNPNLNLNAGTLTAGTAALSLGIRGNGGAISLGTTTVTFPSDADYTLLAAEMVTGHLIVANGTITAPRNLIVPSTVGGLYTVLNNNTFTVTVKTAAGTGIAIPNGQTSILRVGANVIELVNNGFSTGSLGGDVTGTPSANTVVKIRGRAITQPGASEDTWVPRYNSGGTNLVWSKASSIATLGVWGVPSVAALTTGDVESPNLWAPASAVLGVEIPDTGTLEWISILVPSDVGAAGQNVTATVTKNGVNTALTATLNGGAGTETKVLAGTTVTVAQADIISVVAKRVGTPNAIAATFTVYWSCKI
jgi:hypothetical protein